MVNYETTLAAVRELSERAIVRPAPKRLLLARPSVVVVPRAVATYEELHAPANLGLAPLNGRKHTAHWAERL